MKGKEILKAVFFRFAVVTSCICVAVPLFTFLLGGELDNVDIMQLQIVAVSVACALGELILIYSRKILSEKHGVRSIMIIHYIYINFAVIGSGCVIGWFDIHNPAHIIAIAVIILIVYVINFVATLIYNEQVSKKINEKLSKLRGEEEEK